MDTLRARNSRRRCAKLRLAVTVVARFVRSVRSETLATARASTLAIGIFFTPPVSNAIDAINNTFTPPANIGNLRFIPSAMS